jgi:hypothetical protein
LIPTVAFHRCSEPTSATYREAIGRGRDVARLLPIAAKNGSCDARSGTCAVQVGARNLPARVVRQRDCSASAGPRRRPQMRGPLHSRDDLSEMQPISRH